MLTFRTLEEAGNPISKASTISVNLLELVPIVMKRGIYE